MINNSHEIDFILICRSHQQINSLDGVSTSMEPERLTPLKFTSMHSSASFQNGQLVCVKQKYLPTNEIQNNVHILKFGKLKCSQKFHSKQITHAIHSNSNNSFEQSNEAFVSSVSRTTLTRYTHEAGYRFLLGASSKWAKRW